MAVASSGHYPEKPKWSLIWRTSPRFVTENVGVRYTIGSQRRHIELLISLRFFLRFSQVMYMYYLLGHKLMELPISVDRKEMVAENTYLLTLDGDIDFLPNAVQLLVDLMKKNRNLGAACGRIHPVGSGPMVWYQLFEYAIGHWLQKATEHMIGCVLCSPGCFSLFRGKALMDDNVMRKYTTRSDEARHYVQYDQGEDRWLCTLLLQRGYRVEYSAASDAYTHCPEGFNEFYNQRRRWVPSTMANIMDLLGDYKRTIKINDNISLPYIFYQVTSCLSYSWPASQQSFVFFPFRPCWSVVLFWALEPFSSCWWVPLWLLSASTTGLVSSTTWCPSSSSCWSAS